VPSVTVIWKPKPNLSFPAPNGNASDLLGIAAGIFSTTTEPI
jgi:hypothetical protein